MRVRPTIIERAFQLARSGEYEQAAQIARALRLERYESVASHFGSASLKRQLVAECQRAQLQRAPELSVAE